MKSILLSSVLLLSTLVVCLSFYLPGIAPISYCDEKTAQSITDGEKNGCKNEVPVFVNRLNSIHTVVPYEYSTFDFCPASTEEKSPRENLGQVLFGERIRPAPIKLKFLKEEHCSLICTKKYTKADKPSNARLKFMQRGLRLDYQHHWIIDNLPVTWCFKMDDGSEHCSIGFPIGCYVPKSKSKPTSCMFNNKFNEREAYYAFNHLNITITYHSGEKAAWGTVFKENGGRILSVKITPYSIAGKDCKSLDVFKFGKFDTDFEISYTYSVYYEKDDKNTWSSRWDDILKSITNTKMEWFSIMNSLEIVLFLSGIVAMSMVRTLHKDIARYNQMDSSEDAQKEIGWMLVHGDVFRPPRMGMILAVFNGCGIQVFCMTFITLLFACLGFLSPAARGSLMTCALAFFVCLGSSAGYVSARLYKMFGGDKWKSNVLLTAFLCPGIIFGMFFLLNLVLWGNNSSAAVPLTTLLTILGMWFGVSGPLTFVGAYFGFKKRPIEHPVQTNQIPRQIPDQSIYTRPLPGIIMGGVLPFGCIFIQLFFILSSIWSHQTYYMFGFMFLVFIILVVTCSEATVLLCYFHLCAGDYHWWWRSFLTSGFTSVYLFIYCIHFFFTKLTMNGAASTFLYFGYTLIIVFLFFILTGTIGFFSCFWFVSRIYSVVKVK